MTYADAADPRNGPAYHTGKPCIERECPKPAGTAWSPLWCFEQNVERMERINRFFAAEVSQEGKER